MIFSSFVFQSTRPRGARPISLIALGRFSCFNPRAHAGRDINRCEDILFVVDVSIHAPTRGATKNNPLSKTFGPVSIHAPTRGATYFQSPTAGTVAVSIHAPTRGATLNYIFVFYPSLSFNPRAHAGRDHRLDK